MDVTSKAGRLAQLGHRQDLYGESTKDGEFDDLFEHFQFNAGSMQSLDKMAAPSNELTAGMQKYESDDLVNSDRGKQEPTVLKRSSEEVEVDSDEVDEASRLLAKSPTKKTSESKEMDGESARPDGESVNHTVKQKEISIEQAVIAQADKDLSELQHLATDHNPILEAQVARIQQVAKHEVKLQQPKTVQKAQAYQPHKVADEMLQSDDLMTKDMGDVIKRDRTIKLESSQPELTDHMIEGEMETSLLDEDSKLQFESKTNHSKSKQVNTNLNVNHANRVIDTAQEALNVNLASAGRVVTQSGASVKLSAQARTIGALSGVGGAKAKANLRQTLSGPDVNRAKAPTHAAELPDDVDNLSLIRQVSDEMKLRFGTNQNVEINLNPAELGRVRIQMQMQGDNTVNLKVSAEHAVVADLLNLNLNQLRRDLLAQGVQVNEVEVNADAHGQGNEQHSDSDDSSDEQRSGDHDTNQNDDFGRRQFSVQA